MGRNINRNYDNKKEVISFRKKIPPGETDVLSEPIKADGTIEEVRVRFYPGQQGDLWIIPVVEHKGHKLEGLITYTETSEQYLSGDDDNLVFPVVIPVEYDDFVKIRVVNKDTINAYTVVVDVVVDYFGGRSRIVGGVL